MLLAKLKGGAEAKLHSFLTSALCEWLTPRHGRFTPHPPQGKPPIPKEQEAWWDPRAGVDVLEKRTGFEPRPLKPVTQSLYTIRYPVGDRGGTGVKVLCYKSVGRWFDSGWCLWYFSFT